MPSGYGEHVLDSSATLQGDGYPVETVSFKEIQTEISMNVLKCKLFKMNNPDLYILTKVNEFISTLYCVK